MIMLILNWDSKYIDSLNLFGNQLTSLPESFGNLVIGNLVLSMNNLKKLPESFGSLEIGGYLDLSDNKLEIVINLFYIN